MELSGPVNGAQCSFEPPASGARTTLLLVLGIWITYPGSGERSRYVDASERAIVAAYEMLRRGALSIQFEVDVIHVSGSSHLRN